MTFNELKYHPAIDLRRTRLGWELFEEIDRIFDQAYEKQQEGKFVSVEELQTIRQIIGQHFKGFKPTKEERLINPVARENQEILLLIATVFFGGLCIEGFKL